MFISRLRPFSPLLLLVAILAAFGCGMTPASETVQQLPPAIPSGYDGPVPANIIIVMGDGLGDNHLRLLERKLGRPSIVRSFPVATHVATSMAVSGKTDSAASASAFATGHKVGYRVVSRDLEGRDLETVLEVARKKGWKTGLVTTSQISDASPAAFGAHAASRRDEEEIMEGYLANRIDFLAGGFPGWIKGHDDPMVKRFERNGYRFADALVEIAGAKKILLLHPRQKEAADWPEAGLAALLRTAVRFLDGNGFFLFVEHEGIDEASHHKENDWLVKALESYERTVAAALEYARSDGSTLLLVISDHETGGMTLDGDEIRWSTGGHTEQLVPLFAFGPGSKLFEGVDDNAEAGRVLMELMRRAR